MSLLTASRVSKAFRGEPVLRDVSLSIDAGARIGLVGPNGSGKTTLVRILTGDLEPDEGAVSAMRGLRLVYLPQRPEFTPGRTVREEALSAFADLDAMEQGLRDLEVAMGGEDADDEKKQALLARHGDLLADFEARSGWDRERRVEAALAGLGVAEEIRGQEVATLSGGQATRVCLARALLGGPDLLILDEPTNHLDIAATEWLEGELTSRKAACLVISHDRWFLDRVVLRVFELEAARLFSYPGNYGRFEELRAERRDREAKAFEKQAEYIRKEEDFIRRNIAAQRVSMARGKRTRLSRLERLKAPAPERGKMAIPAADADVQASDVLVLDRLAVGIGGRTLLSGFDLRITRGSCVGMVGPNGCGKTTLLRVVAGELAPAGGQARLGPKVRLGFLRQGQADLPRDRTAFDVIQATMPYATGKEVRSWLARFLFSGDEAGKHVGDLSGGEAARLSLALTFVDKPNFLLLDEPTNHLDIPGREALEEALSDFPGTVLLVSHDRYLLEAVADRIVEVRDGSIHVTEGSWSAHVRQRSALAAAVKKEEKSRAGREDDRRDRPEKPGKVRNPFRFARLEEEIIATEARIAEIMDLMAREEVFRDPEQIKGLKAELPEQEAALDRLNDEWEDWVD